MEFKKEGRGVLKMFKRKCFYCGETMVETITKATCGWGKYKFTLEGITAYECPKCGEKVYDSQEAKLIQEIGRAFSALNANERIPENEVLNVKTCLQKCKNENPVFKPRCKT